MKKLSFIALVSALALSPVQFAHAAEAFMKLGDIIGESSDPSHAGEMEVLSWSWGVEHPTEINRGGNVARKSKPGMGSLTFKKNVDKTTPILLEKCANGKRFDDAVLTVRKFDGSGVEYVTITMKKVIITSVSVDNSKPGEDVLTENVTLNFSKIKMHYEPQAPGSSGNVETTWKVEKGQ